MSLGFELATQGSANQYANAFGDLKPADQLAPALGEGLGTGIVSGVMKGGAAAARAVSLAGSVIPLAKDSITGGTKRQDEYFEQHDRIFNRATEYWTPRPHEVGTAGRILGGVAEMAIPLMAGGGNPALLMASAGLGTSEDLARQGVDPSVAAGVGAVQAGAVGVGFKIPFLGRNLLERVAFGATSNVAVGAGAAAVSSSILTRTGHAEQAKQFDPYDTEARAVDVLMGIVFGGVAHGMAPKRGRVPRIDPNSELGRALDAMPESERDALLTANNALHADVSTAPGRPRTLDAQNEHTDALALAMDELDAGRPVSARVDPAGFEGAPHEPFRAEVGSALDEARGAALPEERTPVTSTEDTVPTAEPTRPAPVADGAQPGSEAAASGQPRETLPEVAAAEHAVRGNPELIIPLDDGTVMRAADALAKADQVIAQAQVESRAFDAAVSCILRG